MNFASIEHVLDSVSLLGLGGKGVFGKLTPIMKSRLLELKWDSGESLLSNSEDKRSLSYEIIFLYQLLWSEDEHLSKGEDSGYKYFLSKLNSIDGKNPKKYKEIIFDANIFVEEKRKYQVNLSQLRDKIKLENDGMFTCPKPNCKSKNTQYIIVPARSADEADKTSVTCFSCGYRWSI